MTNDLKPGMVFTKENDSYIVAESSNQRWLVNLNTGKALWLFKVNEGTIEQVEKKGYTHKVNGEAMIKGNKINSIDSSVNDKDNELTYGYEPLSSFEELIKTKVKVDM